MKTKRLEKSEYCDLISDDTSRCLDIRCPKAFCCARIKQLQIDALKGRTDEPAKNFKGYITELEGGCEYFISVDFINMDFCKHTTILKQLNF